VLGRVQLNARRDDSGLYGQRKGEARSHAETR
jgi:hypothetical protein